MSCSPTARIRCSIRATCSTASVCAGRTPAPCRGAGPLDRAAPPAGWPDKLLRQMDAGEPLTAEALAALAGCASTPPSAPCSTSSSRGWTRRLPGALFARAV